MTILVSGYYGFGNEGDELILEGLLHALAPWRGQITVLSQDPRATEARHGVRAASRWQPVALWRELQACRVFISGGGGLVQDVSGPFSPAYYLGLLDWARRLGKRTIVWGQGFIPLRWAGNRWLAKQVLRRADLVIPRDPESSAWCLEQGLEPARVQTGGDLVWLRPWQKDRSGKTWVICLRADWLKYKVPSWLEEILIFARAAGRNLRFVALGNRGDGELLERLRRRAAFHDCEFIAASEGAVRWFADAELVISQRYHGLVLGAQAGAVVTGFGQDPKLARLLQELGQMELEPGKAGATLRRILRQRNGLRAGLKKRLKPLREASRLGADRVRSQLRAWGLRPSGH
ncbi:MAG: polysaccharide pyruvyl transferase CsaB [candidate division FCPU426 bacterium]